MGLDIAFNRAEAEAAGIEYETIMNGEWSSILREGLAMYGNYPDPDHLAWLLEEDHCIKVPGTDMLVSDDGIDCIVVRANQWGDVYTPLTEWLNHHGIAFSAF